MRRFFLFVLLLQALVIAALAFHQVSLNLTAVDEAVLRKMLNDKRIALPHNGNYEEQIAYIRAVQSAVLEKVPVGPQIPEDSPREPADAFAYGSGLCFDRSRTIEKAFRYGGLPARHVFLIARAGDESLARALITPDRISHAVTEVQTARGWLVVDSNAPWLSLDKNGNPVSMQDLAANNVLRLKLAELPPSPIYVLPYSAVYGLYARHGRFYAPYNVIPDVNYRELLDNFRN